MTGDCAAVRYGSVSYHSASCSRGPGCCVACALEQTYARKLSTPSAGSLSGKSVFRVLTFVSSYFCVQGLPSGHV